MHLRSCDLFHTQHSANNAWHNIYGRPEIKYYSIAFFDCITVFQALSRKLPLRVGLIIMRCVNASCINEFTQLRVGLIIMRCVNASCINEFTQLRVGLIIMRCVNASCINEFTQCIWAPPLTKALCHCACFKCGNASEIHDRVIFDFYPGIPHVAVLGRNRTLFHCVFRLHCCVWSALAWNFR